MKASLSLSLSMSVLHWYFYGAYIDWVALRQARLTVLYKPVEGELLHVRQQKRNCHSKRNKYFFVLCRKALSNVVWQWCGNGKSSEFRNLSTSLSISRVHTHTQTHTHTHTHTHAWECINVKRRQGPLSFFTKLFWLEKSTTHVYRKSMPSAERQLLYLQQQQQLVWQQHVFPFQSNSLFGSNIFFLPELFPCWKHVVLFTRKSHF